MKRKCFRILGILLVASLVCSCGKEKPSSNTSVSKSPIPQNDSSVSTTVSEPEPEPEIIDTANYLPTVTLGTYEQDNNSSNGAEPIEWIVIKAEDGKALVISKYILDAVPFQKGFGKADWESSTLRKWLNDSFYNNSFSSADKALILEEKVPDFEVEEITASANDVPTEGPSVSVTPDVTGTVDKVFLLSDFEVKKLLVDDPDTIGDEPFAKATAYAVANGVWTLSEDVYKLQDYEGKGYDKSIIGAGWWWLRTPGSANTKTKDMTALGTIRENGHDNGESHDGIRPALWIKWEE